MFKRVTKLFAICTLGAIVHHLFIIISTDYTIPRSKISKIHVNSSKLSDSYIYSVNSSKKYILQWITPKTESFAFRGFSEGNMSTYCTYTNCVATSNRSLLKDLTRFDVIVFYPPDLFPISYDLPETRSPHQRFVFASRESSHYYPLCMNTLNGFFNWTWTFRLDSDVSWSYLIVKNSSGTVIGPNKIMHWLKLDEMDPVSEEFKAQLRSKTKAAAWFVTNCGDRSGRKLFATKLQIELAKYNLSIDVYGKCGSMKCGEFEPEIFCNRLIKDNYYFYLSFENSFSEDYVTEKLLRALQFNVVPIVYGFANYTRFMPPGIYLNAKDLGHEALAAKMNELIHAPEEYANFFRWRNHYSYHSRYEDDPENSDYCNFCTILNDERKMNTPSVIQNFQKWWDNPNHCLSFVNIFK